MKYIRIISAVLITSLFIYLIVQANEEAKRKAVIDIALNLKR
jgi:hypothetical protein